MAELPGHVREDDAAVLMLDYQNGLSLLMRDFGSDEFRNNKLALTATAKHFRLPTVLTTRKKFTLLLLQTMLLVFSALPAGAAERWEVLPPTPTAIPSERSGQVDANGITIHYAVYGQGSPVMLLHGGLANADYWGNQIQALAPHHTVIVMDSRGHGRSTRDSRPYGYDLMADDVVALMDVLKVPKADIVGWSDGGILGLDLAMRYPDRVA